MCGVIYFFFFFKQKTAYEMRISDWSSDVCSSDLQLMEIAGVDYPDREDRFDVCYHLLSLTKNRRLRVRVITDDVKPVPSVTGIWPVAGWLEREVRSEEHTSELQSLMRISYAVFCLKKKKTKHLK